jgi:hypothetical protein
VWEKFRILLVSREEGIGNVRYIKTTCGLEIHSAPQGCDEYHTIEL